MEAAQQMAVQHEYAYELIPVDIFLEELSLLFQNTMKPGLDLGDVDWRIACEYYDEVLI
jgi:hypothetical protein